MSTKSDLQRWKTAALAISEPDLRVISVPLHVFLGEAVDVARFFDRYWDDQRDHAGVRFGLRSAANRRGRALAFTAKTGAEILELQRACQEAHTAYLLSVDRRNNEESLARGQFLVAEIQATLTWILDDGGRDPERAQLDRVALAHASDPESADALASALDDFAGLAALYAKEMDGVGGFDARLIGEAKSLAAELRDLPSSVAAISPVTRSALDLRNRVVSLLADRITLVRSAARFVFRAHPEIARQATSSYERRRRTASRRAARPAT
jgi:hypothetical protein